MPPPFSFQCGDVISVDFFPNEEDKSKGTERWVIISEVHQDGYLVYPFTSQLHQKARYHKFLEINKSSSLGQRMGLKFDSLLILDRTAKLMTFLRQPILHGNCGQEFLENYL